MTMDDTIKYRLVGTAVLLILAAIFLPMMFKDVQLPARIVVKRPLNRLELVQAQALERAAAVASREPDVDTRAYIPTPHPQKTVEAFKPEPLASVDLDKTDAKPVAKQAEPVNVVKAKVEPVVKAKVEPVVNAKVTPAPKAHTKPHHVVHNTPAKIIKTTVKQVAHQASQIHHPKKPKPTIAAKAWVVQMGSFADNSHAQVLEKRLRQKGFPAFTSTKSQHSGKKVLTRVLVGPETKRFNAERLALNIQQRLQMKGIVVHYSPSVDRG